MSYLRRVVLYIVLLMWAQIALAYRREYRVTVDGVEKHGSEVCFYRGESGLQPWALFFSSEAVRCFPSGTVLDFPPGLYHAFARHPDGFASAHRDYFIYSHPARPDAGYELLEIPLEQAAWLDVSQLLPLRPGQSIGVWLGPSPTTAGSFIPLVQGETNILVPAFRSFITLITEDRRPVAVGEVLTLERGHRHVLSGLQTDTNDVVAWIRVDPLDARQLQTNRVASSIVPPAIALVTETGEVASVFASYAPVGSNTLLIFKRVPAGRASLRAHGKNWHHQEVPVSVLKGRVTVQEQPLDLIPAASVALSWSDAPGAIEYCGTPKPSVLITLSRCKPDTGATDECTPVLHRRGTFEDGAMIIDALAPGSYAVVADFPGGKRVRVPVTLALGIHSKVLIPTNGFSFFGTVTNDGHPLRARLTFETGEAVTDATGRYTAHLVADPQANLIHISSCDGNAAFTYIPARSVVENTAYDFDVANRDVLVYVSNGNDDVEGAQVTFAPVKALIGKEVVRYYTSVPSATDHRGLALMGIPNGRAVLICAAHPQYVATCTEPLQDDELDSRVTVVLTAPTYRGRVVDHDGIGLLALVNESGTVVEQSLIKTNGAFSLNSPAGTGHYLVYASDRRPLFVTKMPERVPANEDLLIYAPAAASRSFTVMPRSATEGPLYAGLWIGDLYVPLSVFAYHQDSRGSHVQVVAGASITVRDVIASAPLSMAFASQRPNPQIAASFADPFLLPENANRARQSVP